MLIALSGIDFRTQLLPDQLTLPLLWLGLLLALLPMFVTAPSSIIGAAIGYLSLWSVYWLFKLATGKEGMGYGDFKLLALFGAWLGWQYIPVIILLSSLVGAIIGIVMVVSFVLPVFVCVAFSVVMVFVQTITITVRVVAAFMISSITSAVRPFVVASAFRPAPLWLAVAFNVEVLLAFATILDQPLDKLTVRSFHCIRLRWHSGHESHRSHGGRVCLGTSGAESRG